ncbi:MAG: hypothetical protein DCF17_05655 [Shackletoniella antarctica]|uniref:histidine kinase n=1 Tax=Shackletoniella antarctica TaxID=268115 RepID=A0A2W4WGB5_9CYAN|nr:MAG: hypothetical protein DCF17_05655 [Shackletoniella antarctica]
MAHLQPQTVIAEDSDLAPGGPPTAPNSMTVLLVSGSANQGLQQPLPSVSQGDHFLETHTLNDALNLWRWGKADWVLLDLAQPEGHGLAFLAAIAATGTQRPLPVTVLVQPGQERDALEAMKLGAADYLYSAEFTPKTLLTSLELHRQARTKATQQATVALPNGCRYYKNLVKNSPDIIERFDLQMRHLYVSPALSKLTGIDSSAFLGKTCRELGMGEAMINAWEAAVAALLAEGEKQAIEFSTPTLLGLRHFEMVLAPEWSDLGQVESILCISRDISDRKTAETTRLQSEALRHELGLLEQILDTVLAGYWDFDFERGTAHYSPGFKAMFGYADDELPNQIDTWQQISFAEDIPIAQASFDRHVKSRGAVPHYAEIRYRHKDGSTVWVICAGRVLTWDQAGQPMRMVGCHVDISQLKQAEAELQTHQTRLQTAQRIGNLGSWEFDLQTQGITWSDQIYRIFGRDPASGPPSLEALTQQFHPDDRDLHQHTIEQAITAGKPYDQEFRILHADGGLRYIQTKGERIVDSDGQPTHLMGTVQDTSERVRLDAERKQAETQLQNLSLRLGLALESANIGTWERDMSSDEVIWDQCLVDLYGFGDLDHSATYPEWRALVYADDIQRVEAGQQALLDHDTPYDIDFRIWRGDGTLGWIRSSALVRRDAQGQPLSFIGINYDITDRKLAEQQILHTTAQLKASNRELEAFAYSVSHDLRAPLRAIDGFSRALVEDYGDQFDAEGRDYFDRIRHNVGRMGQLIDDLLRLSRLSRSTMLYTPVDLSALVQGQINELHTAEPDRVVTVVIIPGVTVSADPTLMQVALTNLVENAWKFTAHHTAATLEFGVMLKGSEPVYYLRDDGAGFDMAYANQLFGVFQRLHNTDEFTGTGIGLATVQRAIHRHGGRVWAEAAVEQGATFYFTLPPGPLSLESRP